MSDSPSDPPRNKRILLVSWHFGKDGATGGFRWSSLVELLAENGWEFDVICRDDAGGAGMESERVNRVDPRTGARGPLEIFPVRSASRVGSLLRTVEELPRRLRSGSGPAPVRGTGAGTEAAALDPATVTVWHPGHRPPLHSRVMREVSACAEMLEIRAWAKEAIRVGQALGAHRNYTAIVVSSPPHGTQMVGVELSRMAGGTPLVADLRDPWVLGLGPFVEILPAVTQRVGRRQEKRLIECADVLVHNTERHRAAVAAELDEMGDMGSGRRPDQWVIQNGTDDEGNPAQPDAEVFRMVFAGWLHPFMDVRAFLRGAGELVRRNGLPPHACRVEFVGTSQDFGGVSLLDLAGAYGLEGYVDLTPRVSRARALAIQARASVLVAFDCLHPLCVPMKFFDYAPMRGRLLLIGNRVGAMADAAARLDLLVCPADDESAVDQVLQGALERWRSGGPWPMNDPDGIFRRSVQAELLHRHLNELG